MRDEACQLSCSALEGGKRACCQRSGLGGVEHCILNILEGRCRKGGALFVSLIKSAVLESALILKHFKVAKGLWAFHSLQRASGFLAYKNLRELRLDDLHVGLNNGWLMVGDRN